MERAFIIGNGKSRIGFDLNQLRGKGTIYGCNALYRDFMPDVLVATDDRMREEIELSEINEENPFEGVDELVKKLIEEGDEKETRQAWLEEIADRAICPVCSSNLVVKKMQVKCESSQSHVSWP